MKILFVDDSKERQEVFKKNTIGHDVTFSDSAKSAIATLDKEIFDFVFLDHDLAPEHYEFFNLHAEDSGLAIVNHIIENPSRYENTKFAIHSLNYSGRRTMCLLLNRSGLRVGDTPFIWKEPETLKALGI